MSEPTKTTAKSSNLPVVITIVLVAAVAIVFAFAFIAASQNSQRGEDTDVAADTYMDIVTPLLANADAARGEDLVSNQFPCVSCHVAGAGSVAPPYEHIAQDAEARAPLTLEAYIYESIVLPHLHVVEGYVNSMPNNYGTLLSDEQLGDIIAYLLTVAEGSDS
ncbi:cytochrome c [Phototrophicus methaneseepsis]|uniref:Cytochrome c n=1 Tax=Phototrophicus methaneseepsis TaxID=2710758 RepID=A0A7S8E5N3_9CHLR|nr:cytochrome c [Phototrophicus methaneseepsis]QPC80800.1 cytochrome c [Phototrophicus methaneseepsis]